MQPPGAHVGGFPPNQWQQTPPGQGWAQPTPQPGWNQPNPFAPGPTHPGQQPYGYPPSQPGGYGYGLVNPQHPGGYPGTPGQQPGYPGTPGHQGGFPGTPGQHPGFPGAPGAYCQNPQIDEQVIENNSGPPQEYVQKVLKILEMDRKSLSPSQLIKFFEKANHIDYKISAIKGGAPFLNSFDKAVMIELVKKANHSLEKIAVVEATHTKLPPGTSYQDKIEIVENIQHDHDRQQAKKIMNL